MRISVSHDFEKLSAQIYGLARKQIPYAAALALTATAKAVKAKMPDAMERALDRPTSFTKRGLFVKAATKQNMVSEVGFMDRQAAYMKYQVFGGSRPAPVRGIKLPGNITLNQFGNIPKGVIDKLKAAAQDGKLGAALAKRINAGGNRRKGAAAVSLFLGKPSGSRWTNAPMGIYRRIPGKSGKLIPVVVFEDTPAQYSKRFDFYRAANEVVAREFAPLFREAMSEAIRTAR